MGSMKMRLGVFGVVVSLAAIAVLSWDVSHAGGQQGKGGKLILTVDVDEKSFDAVEALGEGGGVAFNIVGDIEGGGSFRCWGWIDAGGLGSVSQVYIIPDRGTIMTQGIEGGLLAVTGGTGDFRNLRGEGDQAFTDNGFDFVITFKFQGARG